MKAEPAEILDAVETSLETTPKSVFWTPCGIGAFSCGISRGTQ